MVTMTDADVIAELQSESKWNLARRSFSGSSASIEQACQQRKPLSPVEMRRREFEAVLRIVEAFGYNPDPRRKCVVKDCPNHADAGYFVGDLCSPCHEALMGKGNIVSGERIRSSLTGKVTSLWPTL